MDVLNDNKRYSITQRLLSQRKAKTILKLQVRNNLFISDGHLGTINLYEQQKKNQNGRMATQSRNAFQYNAH